ncbi:hypothetical protein JTB14_001898 [Gonioctena quinquepunctata]|nr:hypothetical protein JTB14_001898 [Gonioctena quinquepunctata]
MYDDDNCSQIDGSMAEDDIRNRTVTLTAVQTDDYPDEDYSENDGDDDEAKHKVLIALIVLHIVILSISLLIYIIPVITKKCGWS